MIFFIIMRTVFNLTVALASVGGIGFSPFAPGTVASLFGMLVFVLVRPSWPWVFGTVLVLTVVGIFVSGRAEKLARSADPSWVVIDEVVGYGVSVLFLPVSFRVGLMAFFLFRFFDIIKPPPVRTVENLVRGGVGVMADDILAGVLTNVVIRMVLYLAQ